MRRTKDSESGISPTSLYKYAVPFALLGILDGLIYLLSRTADSAVTNLIATGIYGVLTVLELGLAPTLAVACAVFWILRTVRREIDVHTWVTLALTLLGLIWTVGKLIFWIRAF